ncbi:MAG: radical SAM family heme chaperone HemW [Duodenibacillus sp.]|nr:radical SAM family heme chaperone HemW [Duodenibacillus sp.]
MRHDRRRAPGRGEERREPPRQGPAQAHGRPRGVLGVVSGAAGLYVHWPWCARKCPYCDFNSRALPAADVESAYVAALEADLAHAARDLGGRPVATVFFGGGTPSLMSPAGFGRLMAAVARSVRLEAGAEVTMEANPGTVDAARLASYAASGVNRFSIGVQSLDAGMLARLGRIHTPDEARAAVEAALEAAPAVNADMMFGLPGQTLPMLLEDVAGAAALGAGHISYYELALEEGSAFAKDPPEGLPGEDLAADMAEAVEERLAAAGYERYEVSAYARPGQRCRHNLGYWTFGDYLGVGAGAHGKVTSPGGRIVRTERAAAPARYLADVAAGRFESARREVPAGDLPFEFMLNALRLAGGVPSALWSERTGRPFSEIAPAVEGLRRRGLMVGDPAALAATPLGRRFLSDVQEAFLAPRCKETP